MYYITYTYNTFTQLNDVFLSSSTCSETGALRPRLLSKHSFTTVEWFANIRSHCLVTSPLPRTSRGSINCLERSRGSAGDGSAIGRRAALPCLFFIWCCIGTSSPDGANHRRKTSIMRFRDIFGKRFYYCF